MSKKNLDELFREQFRDYDAVPDNKVWDNIEASLDKKDKRRILPIWWKLGGVAAILAIFFYVINPFDNTNEEGVNVTTVNETKEIEESVKENDINTENNIKNTQLSTVDTEEENDAVKNEETKEKHLNKNSSYVSNSTKKSLNTVNQNTADFNNINKTNDSNSAATRSNTSGSQNYLTNPKNVNEGVDLGRAPENKTAIVNTEGDSKQNNNYKALTENKNKEAVANNLKEEEKATLEDTKKKSIFDDIKEEEDEAIVENSSKKWSVGPSVAPVYFNGIGEGSPINSSFDPNSKTGDVNFSYGVSVAYEVSKKLKIRSGIHKVDYGYTTNQIEFSSSFNGSSVAQLENINYTANSENVRVNSAFVNAMNSPSFSNDITGKSASLEGNLQQQFGYVEVPLEINYALLDKRFGVNVIGGLSSLFLIDNSVLLNSGDQSTLLGEANNINSVNFSTNIGFGLNYNITPKFQFNVEPVFKYQLNTFSNTSGDFQPFSIGVYSGINYKF